MMKLLKTHKTEIILVLGLILAGQIVFASLSHSFTTPRYEGRIYATTGVRHKQEDLHKLNEAAHYFGQTMIGWLKFPHFFSDLSTTVDLPDDSSISAHIQERQNIIFVVQSPVPMKQESLLEVKDFIQGRLDEYNRVNQTEFVLSNLDYELVEIRRGYGFGAVVSLMASLTLSLALLFLRKEFLSSRIPNR